MKGRWKINMMTFEIKTLHTSFGRVRCHLRINRLRWLLVCDLHERQWRNLPRLPDKYVLKDDGLTTNSSTWSPSPKIAWKWWHNRNNQCSGNWQTVLFSPSHINWRNNYGRRNFIKRDIRNPETTNFLNHILGNTWGFNFGCVHFFCGDTYL